MPTTTYIPLANLTLGSSAASVTFSSINQAYRDLVLIVTGVAPSGTTAAFIRFNNDTGTNYSRVFMNGNGSATSSGTSGTDGIYTSSYFTTTGGGSLVLNIMDYSATDKHKTALIRGDFAGALTQAQASRWASTSALTTVNVLTEVGNWAAGSTFALYGIAA